MAGRATALRDAHRALGARMVDFAGWSLPLHYGSQVSEHHAVRTAAGVFDVSHLALTEVTGRGARSYLRRLLANDIDRLGGRVAGLYSCLLEESGGVLDDLVVYRLADDRYRVVSNAATVKTVRAQMRRAARAFPVRLEPGEGRVTLAVQGPQAMELGAAVAAPVIGPQYAVALAALKVFHAVEQDGVLAARTGYTGEDGFEIYLDAGMGRAFWRALLEAGATPCGLGARDTLRLEAGLCLYGQDMDASVTPLHCGLTWTVAMDPPRRDFIGRRALEAIRKSRELPSFKGLVLAGRGVLRAGQKVRTPQGPGVVTSGGYSPTMSASIGLARAPNGCYTECEVEIRGAGVSCNIVEPPFVRRGRIRVDLNERQGRGHSSV